MRTASIAGSPRIGHKTHTVETQLLSCSDYSEFLLTICAVVFLIFAHLVQSWLSFERMQRRNSRRSGKGLSSSMVACPLLPEKQVFVNTAKFNC